MPIGGTSILQRVSSHGCFFRLKTNLRSLSSKNWSGLGHLFIKAAPCNGGVAILINGVPSFPSPRATLTAAKTRHSCPHPHRGSGSPRLRRPSAELYCRRWAIADRRPVSPASRISSASPVRAASRNGVRAHGIQAAPVRRFDFSSTGVHHWRPFQQVSSPDRYCSCPGARGAGSLLA